MATTIIIPTWSNWKYLATCLESIFDMTANAEYQVVVIDNGSTDETQKYLEDLRRRHSVIVHRNEQNLGFVKAMNQGLKYVTPGQHALWLNDDTQIVDEHWLNNLEDTLDLFPEVGAVGPVSNFVMGLQQVTLSPQITKRRHFTNFLIGFCMLVRAETFQKVGLLDERFLMGGNDDLDYSIRIKDAGYKLMVDRRTFVLHFGAQSISRIGGYEKVEAQTRPLLVAKYGQAVVDELFKLPEGI